MRNRIIPKAFLVLGALGFSHLTDTPPALSQDGLVPTATLAQFDQWQEQSVLGVIYGTDNSWANRGEMPDTVSQRLRQHFEQAGIPFRLLPSSTLADSSVLNRYSFLFLASTTELSMEQVEGLERWWQRGGRLVISGPFASASSQSIRQRLTRLLGVYWQTYVNDPQALRMQSSQGWLPRSSHQPLAGGVLVPTRWDSQVLVTWQNSQEAAVVVNDRLVFLGWDWGEQEATQALDLDWLQAVLTHFGGDRATAFNPPPTQVAPPPAPRLPTPSQRERSQPPSPPSRPTGANPTGTNPTGTNPTATSVQRALPSNFDPSQEVAPPGLVVQEGNEPIIFLEAVAMRQELNNLLGRFRSASLSLNLAQHLAQLTNPSLGVKTLGSEVPPSSASSCVALGSSCGPFPWTQGSLLSLAQPIQTQASPLVTQVKQLLKDFPQVVAEQNYREARRTWLEARATLWDNYPDSQPLQPEIRAVWLDRGTIVRAGSPEGLATLFDRLQAAGINVVFFESLNAGYTIYPSHVAPAQNPLTLGWDPLAAAVELAHDRHMELHAWIWTFAAGNRAHNRILGLPEDYLGPVISAHPDWLNYDNRGGFWSAGKPFLDPANLEVRAYIHRLISEISDRYDVDGIQLDYIRYPFQDIAGGTTFGYGKAGRERFQQRTGVDPKTLTPQHPLWETWQNFRIEQVDSFVAEVGETLRRAHPDQTLSVAVFAFPTHERLAKLQQNWEAWAKRGDVDMVCLMAYALDTNRFEQLTDPWLSNPDLGGTLVMGGINLLSLPNPALVLDQVQFLRDHATPGYVLFATEQFNDTLRQRFRPLDPSLNPATTVLPHREPVKAAQLRYRALQQEWDLLLSQEQILLRSEDLVPWQAARSALDRSLSLAAQNPTAQNLHRASLDLEQFQDQFSHWFYRQEIQDSYQVRTWRHRLSVLTILLNYGERLLDQSRSIALEF